MLDFISNNPWTSFFLAWLILQTITTIISRSYRMIMVAVRGWPPEHLDADGDYRPVPAPVEEE